MGSFSFTYADYGVGKYANIIDGEVVKILIPDNFKIKEIIAKYQDYGVFRTVDGERYDVYELMALHNEDHPYRDSKVGDYTRCGIDGISSKTFQKVIDADTENNRCIGIDIGCYNEQVNALRHPLKIVHEKSTLTYETCYGYSYGDPEQGFRHYTWKTFFELFSKMSGTVCLNGAPASLIGRYLGDTEVYAYFENLEALLDWSFEPDIRYGKWIEGYNGYNEFAEYKPGKENLVYSHVSEELPLFSTRESARRYAAKHLVKEIEDIAKRVKLYFEEQR